jgi:hypothetical protein
MTKTQKTVIVNAEALYHFGAELLGLPPLVFIVRRRVPRF